ncbi:hypothetical protein [Nonomuraea aurantiaca]|uniref:hypothetical protein n=1 Tax=Nonomuraea aurantiaca TaxID=2878562 RepID=UPI001CD9BA00|nr:hypothetical protein [Nonomuraea aurantiaca]MCA2230109.1 hypothetical protein [Nonomuraea aurantiaca]
MTRFTDKTALITGGTSGMGLAAAHRPVGSFLIPDCRYGRGIAFKATRPSRTASAR